MPPLHGAEASAAQDGSHDDLRGERRTACPGDRTTVTRTTGAVAGVGRVAEGDAKRLLLGVSDGFRDVTYNSQ